MFFEKELERLVASKSCEYKDNVESKHGLQISNCTHTSHISAHLTESKRDLPNAINISFLIDTSGSMDGDRIQMAKDIARGVIKAANDQKFGDNYFVDGQRYDTYTTEFLSNRQESIDPVTKEPLYPGRMIYKLQDGKLVYDKVLNIEEEFKFTKKGKYENKPATITYLKRIPYDPVEAHTEEITTSLGGKVIRMGFRNKKSKTDTTKFVIPDLARKEMNHRKLSSPQLLKDFTERLADVQANSGTDLRNAAGYTGIICARSPILNYEDGSQQKITRVLIYLTDDQDTVQTTTNSARNLFRSWTPGNDNEVPIIIVVKIGGCGSSMLAKEADIFIDCPNTDCVKQTIQLLFKALVDVGTWVKNVIPNRSRTKAIQVVRKTHTLYVPPLISTTFWGPRAEHFSTKEIALVEKADEDGAAFIAKGLLEQEKNKLTQLDNTEKTREKYRRRGAYDGTQDDNKQNHSQNPTFVIISAIDKNGRQLIGTTNNGDTKMGAVPMAIDSGHSTVTSIFG